jgi:hypothetical protein
MLGKRNKKDKKDNRELWYRLLYFVIAIYPVWFLWRHKTNDHVYHWFATAIQVLFIVDFSLYYTLYSDCRTYWVYVARDVVLNFTLATCFTIFLLEIVISHPRPNFVNNQNGILESEQDANIISGWLFCFMALIVRDQIKCHRYNVFKPESVNSDLMFMDWLNIIAVAVVGVSPLLLVLSHCSNFADGCHDPNLGAT